MSKIKVGDRVVGTEPRTGGKHEGVMRSATAAGYNQWVLETDDGSFYYVTNPQLVPDPSGLFEDSEIKGFDKFEELYLAKAKAFEEVVALKEQVNAALDEQIIKTQFSELKVENLVQAEVHYLDQMDSLGGQVEDLKEEVDGLKNIIVALAAKSLEE